MRGGRPSGGDGGGGEGGLRQAKGAASEAAAAASAVPAAAHSRGSPKASLVGRVGRDRVRDWVLLFLLLLLLLLLLAALLLQLRLPVRLPASRRWNTSRLQTHSSCRRCLETVRVRGPLWRTRLSPLHLSPRQARIALLPQHRLHWPVARMLLAAEATAQPAAETGAAAKEGRRNSSTSLRCGKGKRCRPQPQLPPLARPDRTRSLTPPTRQLLLHLPHCRRLRLRLRLRLLLRRQQSWLHPREAACSGLPSQRMPPRHLHEQQLGRHQWRLGQ